MVSLIGTQDSPGNSAQARPGPGFVRRATSAINTLQQDQRGALMPWCAVMMGLGVALYFSLSVEPGLQDYAMAGGVAFCAGLAGLRHRETLGPVALGIVLIAAGFALAGLRAHGAAGPVLDFRYYGAIEGRIVALDRSASDAVRITLEEVRLEDLRPERTPHRVRVSLHGAGQGAEPPPGALVMITGHLGAPGGPSEPGGFDFQRHAWFQSLGGVGYARTPLVVLEHRVAGEAPLFHLRMRLSAAIQAEIPGQPGAFAAAVLTGDRAGLDAGPIDDMRKSNIAHLLAISGLHMGLLTGFVYTTLRALLALIPAIALRYPIRKWAAASALVAGAFYLALSGGNVATERAFIQVGVMFTAVLLDRRAVTLRSVAIAAILLLVHRPETLMSPGFQMSFAATAALVGVFSGLRDRRAMQSWPGWLKGVSALVISSAVAGAATGPFGAAHFNQIASYGLIANLLSVPVMGSLIIPGAVLALLLWPLGLAGPVFYVLSLGLQWILGVAHRVASMPGAVDAVPSPPPGTLGVLSLAALFILLWRGRVRWLGVVPIALAFGAWTMTERPPLLISETGRLVGIMGPESRALSRPRGDGFSARIWMENDGAPAAQDAAAARTGWQADGPGVSGRLGDLSLWHGSGKTGLRGAAEACARHDLLILSEPAVDAGLVAVDSVTSGAALVLGASGNDGGCTVIDGPALSRMGSISMDEGLVVTTARAEQGARLWSITRDRR